MPETTITVDATTHELARREVLKAAAIDMQDAAEMFEDLTERVWPVDLPARVQDAKGRAEQVRESLAAVEALGWPDTDAEAS